MKKGAALTLFFFCIIVFSAVPPASAHETYKTTAEEASDANTGSDSQKAERAMKDFLLHLKEHRKLIKTEDGRIEFRNALRNDNGIWRHGDTYVITVNKSGSRQQAESGSTIFFHAKYPAALSGSLRDVPVFELLMTRVDQADGEPVCVQAQNGETKHICAVEDSHATGAGDSFIQIAGFDHEPGDVDLSGAEAACPDFTPGDLQSRGWLSADMVNDEESLVSYLKGVEAHVSEELAGGSVQPRERMVQLMPCWRKPPWKSGSIYFYITIYTDKQYGIFNGLTPQFQDTTLLLIDDNGLNIGEATRKIVEAQDEGFLTYLWDNPVVRGDEVVCEETGPVSGPSPDNEGGNEDEEVFCEEGNPVPGRSPGTSVKRGYFIRTDFGVEGGTEYVLGSGIYPKPRGGGGGGGCAIASVSGNGHGAEAFGLFLITAALFLVASGKSRSGGKLPVRDPRARRKSRRR